jgi:prophage maintenance system killer protein
MAQGDGGQVDWLDELVGELRGLHDQIIQESGGVLGEHTSSLFAACARPFQTAFGEEIYRNPFSKAAAFFHAIICDHVFVDGNKRTATIASIYALVLKVPSISMTLAVSRCACLATSRSQQHPTA